MYETHFGLREAPFSIAPNPHYLYMSSRHREAMAHLLYGIREGGGFVQLTGEVGTGKTTLCRQLLAELPADVDVALILNPRIDELELMQSICDELRIDYPEKPTLKGLLDALNRYLLAAHGRGRNTVLIIDEAQNLEPGVLEQVRLLTNLETTRKKLLQIILIGQGELRDALRRRELRQLSQRITARYHLEPLGRREVGEYVAHRLARAGCERRLFTGPALRRLHALSRGVPRLVNVLCDRALLGAWSRGADRVNRATMTTAGRELSGTAPRRWPRWVAAGLLLAALAGPAAYTFGWLPEPVDRELRHWMPTWVPRWHDGAVARAAASGWLAHWLPGAHAAPEPQVGPAVSVEPPSRRSLPAAKTAPVRLSQLEQMSAEAAASHLRAHAGGPGSRVAALRELARAWALEDSSVFDCVGVGEFGLSCLRAPGGWDQLAALDRPAVVELGDDGVAGYAVLRYLVDEQAVLRAGGIDFVLTRRDFETLWRGSAVVFWRRPPLASVPVDETSPAEDILWLRRALNLEGANHGGGTLARVDRAEFDAEMLAALHGLQRRSGLPQRDQAAEEELIVLSSRLGYEFHPSLVY